MHVAQDLPHRVYRRMCGATRMARSMLHKAPIADVGHLKGEQIFAPDPRAYQVCTRCVMDTSDRQIEFDGDGVCSHCHAYDASVAQYVLKGREGQRKLAHVVAEIKEQGRNKAYDCIIGLSGGVDSTYTAWLAKEQGLRPLAVHLDNGWNSEIAVANIEQIVRRLGFHLHTEVLDWQEFRSLQVAFLRASTPDSEIPTDHAIVATLFELAAKHGLRHIVEGSNYVTEAMVPRTWSAGHADWRYIEYLNDNFGGAKLKTYPHYTFWDQLVRYPLVERIRRVPVLDWVEYDKPKVVELIKRELGWKAYGAKHYESIYTRFYQGYVLPTKFGFDKRRPHLSCLVNDGRMARERALAELNEPAIPAEQLREDRAFVLKKLCLSEAEFEAIMAAPRKTFWDYPSYEVERPYGRIIRSMGAARWVLNRLRPT